MGAFSAFGMVVCLSVIALLLGSLDERHPGARRCEGHDMIFQASRLKLERRRGVGRTDDEIAPRNLGRFDVTGHEWPPRERDE